MQDHLPQDQQDRAAAALPGIAPVGGRNWVTVDGAYAAQIAEKKRLLALREPDVLAMTNTAPVAEFLKLLITELGAHPDFRVVETNVHCPDGRCVSIDHSVPFHTVAQLIQEDICILEKHQYEHVLTAALLCFPAGWVLADKIGRPLMQIHAPVPEYDAGIGKRVQRLFDGVQVGRPLWRANLLSYADPDLYAPHKRTVTGADGPRYLRSERQTILRMPQSGAVVFAIHTTVVASD